MELGSNVFCMDPKTKEVYEAKMIGAQISTTGYEICSVLSAKGDKKQLESAHVHKTKKDAQGHVLKVRFPIAEADKIMKDAAARIDVLRFQVIGKPQHEDLANRIMEKKA